MKTELTEMADCLGTKWAGRHLVYQETVTSTNTEAKLLAAEGMPQGTLVVAASQTAGRGRRGRTWQSPAGQNLYCTLILRPNLPPDCVPMVTLVMAYAVSRAIEQTYHQKAGIKWPNDIVMNGRKICGILTEMAMDGPRTEYVVIGVGINIGREDFDQELQKTATSLEQETGMSIPASVLLGHIMEQFETAYEEWEAAQSLAPLTRDYNEGLVNRDRQVKVLDPQGEYTGIARGINDKGELLVEKEDGSMVKVYAGEVSVRGIYGYV